MTVCPNCRGDLRNIEGRRMKREKLEEIHRDTCPGVKHKKKVDSS